MKKAIAGVAVALAVLSPVMFLCSCKKSGAVKGKTFGEFSYNGKSLTEYATKEITAEKAKEIINKNTEKYASVTAAEACGAQLYNVQGGIANAPLTPQSVFDRITREYGNLEITTHYYVSDSGVRQSKVDLLQMTDFSTAIKTNTVTPFNQLVAKNIVVFDELINFMEQENTNFRNSSSYVIAPFKNIFTYHTDSDGNLIIQTRDFAELASSVGGGIGCSYRQDTEIIYDAELKVKKWQTSLGVYSAAPKGTIKQGYILEIDFDWNLKDG